MQLLFNKTEDDLNDYAMTKLTELNIPTDPGSIAKLLLNIENHLLGEHYKTLTVNHLMHFLSQAKDDFLDSLGLMVHCIRILDEDDDTYRDRISKQVLNAASANKTAVELAVLSVAGIIDCKYVSYLYGSGSFACYIVTDDYIAAQNTIELVKEAVDSTAAYGIYYVIDNPTLMQVKFSCKLILSDNITDSSEQEIRFNVKKVLSTYFTSLSIGENIVIDDIIETVKNVSDYIIEIVPIAFSVNNINIDFVDQTCSNTERFVLSLDDNSLTVS